MHEVLNACGKLLLHAWQGSCKLIRSDGENALSYTLWDYEPTNTHLHGDGWNGEDLSLFSYDDIPSDLDLVADDPPDVKSLVTVGARGIESWCRAYPLEVMGKVESFEFDYESADFHLRIQVRQAGERARIEDEVEKEGEGVGSGNVVGRLHEGQDQAGLGSQIGQGQMTLSAGGQTHKEEQPREPIWSSNLEENEGLAIILVPYVHYLHTSGLNTGRNLSVVTSGAVKAGGNVKQRLIGEPSRDQEEWEKGRGPARVDLEVEVSHGRVEAEGQWVRWVYPVGQAGGAREIMLRKWRG